MKLSTMSALVRKGIVFLLIFVVFYYIFILLALPVAKKLGKNLFPSKDAATVLYGKLDPLEFSPKTLLNPNQTYVLNTKNGKLPAFPEKMTVFKYKTWSFSYADGPNAMKNAQQLGFTDANLTTDLKDTSPQAVYSWRNPTTGSTMDIKIHSKELFMQTPLAGKYDSYAAGTYSQTTAVEAAKNLFVLLDRFKESTYRSGTQTVYFGRITNSGIASTTNIKEAHVARVDLFRTIGKVPVYGPDPKKGLLEVYVAKPGGKTGYPPYPRVEAYYWEIESSSNATYPLIPVSEAWDDISKGKGIISSVVSKESNPFAPYTPVKVDRIFINSVTLAYYDTPKQQKYMQPIYVFEGNYTAAGGDQGTITIYYPAVSGEWVSTSKVPETAPLAPSTNTTSPAPQAPTGN